MSATVETRLLHLHHRCLCLLFLVICQFVLIACIASNPATGAAPPKRAPAAQPILGLSARHPLPKLYVSDLYVDEISVDNRLTLSPNAQRNLARTSDRYRRIFSPH